LVNGDSFEVATKIKEKCEAIMHQAKVI
jgi:hypothetical protein